MLISLNANTKLNSSQFTLSDAGWIRDKINKHCHCEQNKHTLPKTISVDRLFIFLLQHLRRISKHKAILIELHPHFINEPDYCINMSVHIFINITLVSTSVTQWLTISVIRYWCAGEQSSTIKRGLLIITDVAIQRQGFIMINKAFVQIFNYLINFFIGDSSSFGITPERLSLLMNNFKIYILKTVYIDLGHNNLRI